MIGQNQNYKFCNKITTWKRTITNNFQKASRLNKLSTKFLIIETFILEASKTQGFSQGFINFYQVSSC